MNMIRLFTAIAAASIAFAFMATDGHSQGSGMSSGTSGSSASSGGPGTSGSSGSMGISGTSGSGSPGTSGSSASTGTSGTSGGDPTLCGCAGTATASATNLGGGCGDPLVFTGDLPILGMSADLDLTSDLPAYSPVTFLTTLGPVSMPMFVFGGCELWVNYNMLSIFSPGFLDINGNFHLSADIPNDPILDGLICVFQSYVIAPGGVGGGVHISNAIEFLMGCPPPSGPGSSGSSGSSGSPGTSGSFGTSGSSGGGSPGTSGPSCSQGTSGTSSGSSAPSSQSSASGSPGTN